MHDRHRDPFTRRSFLRTAFRIGATTLVALPGSVQLATPFTTGSAAPVGDPGVDVGFSGTVIDLATLAPLPGALVTAEPGGTKGVTGPDGKYSVTLPPGRYSVHFSATSYIETTYLNQDVVTGTAILDANLLPTAPTPDQQALLYPRAVRQFVSPLVDQITTDRAAALGRLTTLPDTITINYDAATGADPPYMISVPLEDYVKSVVPNEVPASWPANTLQAQAVAARSYGVASQHARGFVYPDTRSQVYNPNYRTSTTDAATDATAGVVITVNGSVVFAYFFSSCNGVGTRDSENLNLYVTDSNGNIVHNGKGQAECASCASKGTCWNYVSYCRARSCDLHGPSTKSDCGYWGHGVGMCQWGAYSRGNLSYVDILNSYYTGVSIVAAGAATPTPTPTFTPTPTPTPTPVPTPQPTGPFLILFGQPTTITWLSVGGGATYYATLGRPGSPPLFSTSTFATSWPLPGGTLALGAWILTIYASNNTMASATLNVVLKIYQDDLPRLAN